MWFGATMGCRPKEDKWYALPLVSSKGGSANLRNQGGTAVIGSKIYCVGVRHHAVTVAAPPAMQP